MKQYISSKEALNLILKEIHPLPHERITLLSSLGKATAENILSGLTIPSTNISSRDGFALKSIDTQKASIINPVRIKLNDCLDAGEYFNGSLKPKEAIQIMTGAPIPKGADAVIPIEETQKNGSVILINKKLKKMENIRKKGIEARVNECVIKKGTAIRPAEIARLASLGYDKIEVIQTPKIGIISTGNELVNIKKNPLIYQVRDCNSPALAAQILQCKAKYNLLGIIKDDLAKLKKAISQGTENDMLIISGGASMGNKDLTLSALTELKAKIKFWKIKIKPGYPCIFAVLKNTPIFCNPGVPATSYVIFEKFIRPAILKMMGHTKLERYKINAVIAQRIELKKGMRHFLRVKIVKKNKNYHVYLSGTQIPVLLKSIVTCDGLMTIPENIERILPGEIYQVELLN